MDGHDLAERRRRRDRVKATYPQLFDEITAILGTYDPLGIVSDENSDEYESETGTILPRLEQATSATDVERIVHDEFLDWFGEAFRTMVGAEHDLRAAARAIWAAWQHQRGITPEERS